MKKLSQEELDLHRGGSDTPNVYVGTYGKYNNGDLSGMWVDLSSFYDYDEFIEFIKDLHSDEDDPEFMMQDYENFPRAYYSECLDEDSFDKIMEWNELDDEEKDAFECYIDNVNSNADKSEFEDAYCGKWCSAADYAEDLVESCGDLESVPNWLRGCIDWQMAWELMRGDGYESYDAAGGGVYIFNR